MFSKLKLRKAPLSLSSVSNAIKTAGLQDLSPAQINAKTIDIATISQLGLPKNSINAVAFDPVQSLLAVSTGNTIRVFGQTSVEVVFEFSSSSPIIHLKFLKGVYLVGVSASSNITVLSLHSKSILATFLASGTVTAVQSGPSLDWLLLGLGNGGILFYDVDICHMTPFRIDNLQKKVLPKQKLSPVLSIEWHPRDIGTILVTYSHCAIIYSLTTGEIKNAFILQLSKGSKGYDLATFIDNGGKKKMFGSSKDVIPELVESHFHPNGLHIVTIHRDNSIVFWDATSATMLQARKIFETNINQQGPPLEVPQTFSQIQSVRWICGEDPEVTLMVISGGDPHSNNLLHVLDFGYTLKYSITSHEKQGEFYAQPQSGQRIIPITFNEASREQLEPECISEIFPLAADNSPYFGGNHNPPYLLLRSNIGSIYFIEYSSEGGAQGGTDLGSLILPTSVGFIHPPVTVSSVQTIRRIDWYSVLSNRVSTGSTARTKHLLRGGADTGQAGHPKPIGFDDSFRSILVTGHEGGLIRFLDISRGDRLEGETTVQISLKETLFDDGNSQTTKIVALSCAFEGREMLVGMGNGDVVICKFGKHNGGHQGSSSTRDYRDCPVQHANENAKILSINDRISGSFALSSTFLPVSLLQVEGGEQISVLKMSNIGFAAIGYKSGRLVVCDIGRGPAVIFNLESITKHLASVQGDCYPTTMEFSIMEYGQEGFSSIILFVGTNCGGNLLMFKVIPKQNGAFDVVFADKTIGLNYRAIGNDEHQVSKLDQIIPISAKNGQSTVASLEMFNKLSQGLVIPGYVITTSHRDLRVLKLPKVKLSHKVIDDTVLRSGLIQIRESGVVLACILKTGFIKFLSLPALNDIADIKVPKEVFERVKASFASGAATQSDILSTGDLFVKTSDTESINLVTFNKESRLSRSKGPTTDLLFNENAIIPPRPAAGALLWAKGQTKYISTEDLTFLIAGPNRKPPKNDESRLAHNISPEANPNHGYGGYLGRSNTDNLGTSEKELPYKTPVRKGGAPAQGGFVGPGFMRSLQSGIESVEESFNGYANTMSETMNEGLESSKKSFYSSAIKSKIGM